MRIKQITLQLVDTVEPSLYLFEMWEEGATSPRQAVRGKLPGALARAGTFQWTKAVRAMTLLLVRHAAEHYNPTSGGLIYGEADTLASSLDYAISKNTGWLCDMFGSTSLGVCNAARLFSRCNSNRKRPGPVMISVNSNLLRPDQIKIRVHSTVLDGAGLRELEALILRQDPDPVSRDRHLGMESSLQGEGQLLKAA